MSFFLWYNCISLSHVFGQVLSFLRKQKEEIGVVNKEKKQKNCKPRNKSLNTVTLETINWLEETPAKLQVQQIFKLSEVTQLKGGWLGFQYFDYRFNFN